MTGIAEDITASRDAESQLRVKADLLAVVAEAMSTFLKGRDWNASISLILRAAISQTESEYGFVAVLADGNGEPALQMIAHQERDRDSPRTGPPGGEARGQSQDFWGSELKRDWRTLFGTIVTSGKALISNNRTTDPGPGSASPEHPQPSAFVGVPIFREATAVGLIVVANRPGGYGQEELECVETLAGPTGVVYDSWSRQQREADLQRARREAEESAAQRQAELEHVLRMVTVGEVASGLAHEINQPLAAIASFVGAALQFIKSGHADQNAMKETLEQATRETQRAGAIMRRLGNLARRRVPRLESDDLNQILQSICPLLEMEAERRGVTLQVEPAPEWLPVKADRVQCQQVVLNLLRNALESVANTGGAGEVQIRTYQTEEGMAELALRDTGTGISSSVADRMFDAFFTTKPQGLGMGLTISGFVMEAHGGRLSVATNPDCGATARLALPLRRKDHNDGM